MPLTAFEIHNKEFKRGIRGYSEDEVNEFLAQVMKDYEMFNQEKKQLEEKVLELEERLKHYDNLEETLNKSIVIAIKTGEEAKRSAQREAELIVQEAERKAEKMVDEAESKEKKILDEIEDLKKQSRVFQTRLKKLVEAQLELLDNGDWSRLDEKEEVNEGVLT